MRVVDLFCGAGGFSAGASEAARRAGLVAEFRLAVDSSAAALSVYARNFPAANCVNAHVESLFDGELGAPLTSTEEAVARAVGPVDVLLGGPPCQGHSDLNNHTRRNDPRNQLYSRMARAAEVLVPKVTVVENVPAVTKDVTGVVDATERSMRLAGYAVSQATVAASAFGVPQTRRRHLLVASRVSASPGDVLQASSSGCVTHNPRTVAWAISDLLEKEDTSLWNSASRPGGDNLRRINWLHEHGAYDLPNSERPQCHRSSHSYRSMYGRLHWNKPAQTITSGFNCTGQGRYVHPVRPRTLTPHEAARLQTLPDWFDFGGVTTRGTLSELIANCVPPLLAAGVLAPVVNHLRGQSPASRRA